MTTGSTYQRVLSCAPPPLASLLRKYREEAGRDGYGAADAENVALRMIQHAGWYETDNGWKQLSRDVRDKVIIRKAHRQPDGRYFIADLIGFYPNAVKNVDGQPITYTASDIRTIIDDSNRCKQLASLTPYHVTPEHKLLGHVVPSIGKCFNWREVPGRPGFTMFDARDVEPQTVEAWRRGQITGFSPGIVQDGAGLNKRFGHVAALGAEAPALSQIPTTEIFSVSDNLCFSAEVGAVNPKGKNMDHNKLKPHIDALNAAYAACAAGEPEAHKKMEEAHKNFSAAYNAEMAGAGTPPPPTTDGEPAAMDTVPGTSGPSSLYAGDAGDVFAANPQAAFSALVNDVRELRKENEALKSEREKSAKLTARQQFEAHLNSDESKAHNFDAGAMLAMFDAAEGAPKVVEQLKAMIAKSPMREVSPAEVGQVFDASNSGPVASAAAKKPEKKPAEQPRRFSRQDYIAGISPESQSVSNFAAHVADGMVFDT